MRTISGIEFMSPVNEHPFVFPKLTLNAVICAVLFALYLFGPARVNSGGASSSEEKHQIADPVISIDEIVGSIDPDRMLAHIDTLSREIGVRVAGSEKEREAENYIARELEGCGYLVTAFSFALDNGRTSENIVAELPGERDEVILIGAHYDSESPSPGANDNGSGVAVMLEVARVLSNTIPPYTCTFTAFGSEEIIDGNPDHHHYGSRFMASDPQLTDRLYCMNSIDMVGVGTEPWIDNMGISDDGWREWLSECASAMGIPTHTGETRAWSDHEAFERADLPVAWIHWRYDNKYHTAGDAADRIQPELLAETAELIVRSVLGVDGATAVSVRNPSEIWAF